MSVSVGSALVVALVAVGCFFLTVGTVGLLRFPNVYNRMHATSKPTTLGTAAIFLAGFVRFGPGGAGLPSLLGIAFLFLTVPTGAHMISRSAQRTGVPFLPAVTWPGTATDGRDGGAADGGDGGDDGATDGGDGRGRTDGCGEADGTDGSSGGGETGDAGGSNPDT